MKVVMWIALNGATLMGVLQGIVKVCKEICTGIINVLFPFFPDDGKFERTVLKVRDFFNTIDNWLDNVKSILLEKEDE
jgi:hypothetical protein